MCSSDLSQYTVATNITRYVVLEVNDGCGSTPLIDSTFIMLKPVPLSAFSYSPVTPSVSNPGVSFTDQSIDAVRVLWTFGDGDSTDYRNPYHEYKSPGTYTVTQYTIAANGCIDSVSYVIVVSDKARVNIPKSFTPNGDGINEVWIPVCILDITYTYTIFDRWGHVIFEGDEKHSWDGSFKSSGKLVPPGVYDYLIDFGNTAVDEKEITTGRITLIR